MKKSTIRLFVSSLALLLFTSVAYGTSLFDLSVTNTTVTAQRGFSNISNALDSLNNVQLAALLPGYLPTDPLTFSMKFRGLPNAITVTSLAGSPNLTLTIPDTGFTKTFTGTTRDASKQAISDWFKKDGGAELNKLMKKLAELTPSDPLAGNPNSLMSRVVASSFDRGFVNKASMFNSPEKIATSSTDSNPNLITLGFDYSKLKQKTSNQGTFDASTYSLPLGYTWVFNNPLQQISFDLPLTYMEVQGAKVYNIEAALSYSHPLLDNWILTPAVNYGAMFSSDMGSGGHILNASVTSSYTHYTESFTAHLGNMVAYVTTIPVKVGDYSSDPDIKEFTIKNGLLFYVPTPQWLPNTGIEVFALDTRFFGDKLFNPGYTEAGFSYGFTKRFKTSMRIGASYLFAKDNNGFKVNFGYTF